MKPLDVSRQTNALFRKLDLDPSCVSKVIMWPHAIEATVFLTNEQGKKYVLPSGKVAQKKVRIEVKT